MVGELARKLGKVLLKSRENSGHNRLSVEHFSRQEAARRGEEFFVHNTSLLKYERGGWPSPPKLLTLCRAYGAPLGKFFKAIGARDNEICGHAVSKQEQELVDYLREPGRANLHWKLRAVLEEGGAEAGAVASVIEMAAANLEPSAEEKIQVAARFRRDQPLYVNVPFFDSRLPEGPLIESKPDGARKVEEEAAFVGAASYVLRVPGSAMSPELRAGDLVLVDADRQPRSGDFVCALLNGASLVRELVRRGPRTTLRALNSAFPEIEIGKDDELHFRGVIVRVVGRDLSAV